MGIYSYCVHEVHTTNYRHNTSTIAQHKQHLNMCYDSNQKNEREAIMYKAMLVRSCFNDLLKNPHSYKNRDLKEETLKSLYALQDRNVDPNFAWASATPHDDAVFNTIREEANRIVEEDLSRVDEIDTYLFGTSGESERNVFGDDLFELAEKYRIPLTNNTSRYQDGVFLLEVSDFIGDIRRLVQKHIEALASEVERDFVKSWSPKGNK